MSWSRKKLLRTSLSAAGTAWCLPRFAIGKSGGPASEKLNVAIIGAGGMGSMCVGASKLQNIMAFADVDTERASESYRKYLQVPRYKDFRKMIEKHQREIDVVLISRSYHSFERDCSPPLSSTR